MIEVVDEIRGGRRALLESAGFLSTQNSWLKLEALGDSSDRKDRRDRNQERPARSGELVDRDGRHGARRHPSRGIGRVRRLRRFAFVRATHGYLGPTWTRGRRRAPLLRAEGIGIVSVGLKRAVGERGPSASRRGRRSRAREQRRAIRRGRFRAAGRLRSQLAWAARIRRR